MDTLGTPDSWDVAGNQLFYVCVEPARSLFHLTAIGLVTGNRRVLGDVRRLSLEWKTGVAGVTGWPIRYRRAS